jgi:hypothetical protein
MKKLEKAKKNVEFKETYQLFERNKLLQRQRREDLQTKLSSTFFQNSTKD